MTAKTFSYTALTLMAALSCSVSSTHSALAGEAQVRTAQANVGDEVLIKATPKVVWKAIHEERNFDPGIEYSKEISNDGNSTLIEQKFVRIPLLGSVVATTKQVETPYSRIDYTLVKSDRFKKLEGSWTLQAVDGGRATKLRLASQLDIGIPFSQIFTRNASNKKVVDRVAAVKRMAEADQARLAATGKLDY
ncbi:MAG: SRPBCC family protein [Candidatus Obscuribacterales bacterium]